MKLIIKPSEISHGDPFKGCLFGRKPFGETLLNLIKNSEDELIISLDANWGEGKTTFVKMWQALLDNNNLPNIYINAFENDFTNDPFVSVAGAIIEHAKKNKLDHVGLLNKAKKIGTLVASSVSDYAIQKISCNTLDGLDEAQEKAHEAVSNATIYAMEKRLKCHKDDIDLIKSFKSALSKIAANEAPLVIIIDELDRCKPTYAVELIEKIKHIFSTENVFFLLVMHKEQLLESLKCVYGQGLDASTYLQKFIHIDTTLPKIKSTAYSDYNDVAKYCDHLCNNHGLINLGTHDFIKELAGHLNLSLRQLEKIYTIITLYYGSFSRVSHGDPALIAILSILKVSNSKLYNNLLEGRATFQDVEEKCHFSEMEQNRISESLKRTMSYALMNDDEFSELSPEQGEDEQIYCSIRNQGQYRKDMVPNLLRDLNSFSVNR